MASTLNFARRDFSEDRLWPTEPSAGSADEQSRPSTYEFGGMGKAGGLSAEIKLLAELEKDTGGRPTKITSEPRPVSTAKLTDLDEEIRPVASNTTSRRKRTARGFARVLIIFSMGIAATLVWQSYGDATREMIASSHPQLGWLAPETVAAETNPEITPSIAPATTSDSQEKTVAAETIPETTSPIALATNSDSQEKTVAAETAPERTSPIAPATASDSQEIKAILMAVRQNVDQLAARQQQMANDIATLKATERNLLRNISSAASARPPAAPARKPVPVSSRSPQEPPVR